MATGLQRWYPAPDIFTIGDGAQLYIHPLVGGCCETTVEMVRDKLVKKWGIPTSEDEELAEVVRVLSELGYELHDIASKQGDDRVTLSPTQLTDKEQKKLADICEILAAIVQEEVRGIPEADLFLSLQRKISVAAPEHGIDYLAFRFDKSHKGIFPVDNEIVVLGESKHTSSTSSLDTACRETGLWIRERLTKSRLYVELTNIADQYRRFGNELKRGRVLGFIPSIYNWDERVTISSTMLYIDSISDETVVSDFQKVLVALDQHKEGAIPHRCLEGLLFKVIDLDHFCKSCYEDFSNGST